MAFKEAQYRHLETVDSTNDEAARWLKMTRVPEGSFVVADYQTHGKGQRDNVWTAKQGLNLTCSCILYPKGQSENAIFYFSKAIACAVCDTIAECGCEDVTIKWPNDTFIGRKKVAGVLIENQWGNQGWTSAIVGIGINVNQQQFEGLSATSIMATKGAEQSIAVILSILRQKIEDYYKRFQEQKFEEIDAHYHRYLFGLNTFEKFDTEEGNFEGKIALVNPNGQLGIELDTGEIRFFNLKEVKLLL